MAQEEHRVRKYVLQLVAITHWDYAQKEWKVVKPIHSYSTLTPRQLFEQYGDKARRSNVNPNYILCGSKLLQLVYLQKRREEKEQKS